MNTREREREREREGGEMITCGVGVVVGKFYFDVL